MNDLVTYPYMLLISSIHRFSLPPLLLKVALVLSARVAGVGATKGSYLLRSISRQARTGAVTSRTKPSASGRSRNTVC